MQQGNVLIANSHRYETDPKGISILSLPIVRSDGKALAAAEPWVGALMNGEATGIFAVVLAANRNEHVTCPGTGVTIVLSYHRIQSGTYLYALYTESTIVDFPQGFDHSLRINQILHRPGPPLDPGIFVQESYHTLQKPFLVPTGYSDPRNP